MFFVTTEDTEYTDKTKSFNVFCVFGGYITVIA